MSFTLHGLPVSSGIAIGHAHLVSHASLEVSHYILPKGMVQEEVNRLDAALEKTRNDLTLLHEHKPQYAAAEFDAFIDLHLMILQDVHISQAAREMIMAEHCNAEWALKVQMDDLVMQFEAFEDSYLRERKTDVVQVVERILKTMGGQDGHAPPTAKHDVQPIMVAHDVSPADLIQLKPQQFAGILTDLGGATSHTSIVARSLNKPCVVGLHHARELIKDNDMLIVDGAQGVVIVNPDKQILAEYRLRHSQLELERQKLKRLKTSRATTLDGTPVELHANIELPSDLDEVKDNGAGGIGLFRSEFLFLNRDTLPDEEEQFVAYRTVAEGMNGLPVTIRTFDLGADKQLKNGTKRVASNPALGLRAIRLCLAEPQLFKTQLRALLRASVYGNIKILIPMLSGTAEINQTLNFIAAAKVGLDIDGLKYNPSVQIGGMIEIPAAALSLHAFTKKLDFLSIGTNDLIQYTLAIDRTDDEVAHLYDPLHPAVLHLLSHVITGANKAGIPVSVCGEMAGELAYTRLLLGIGLRQFSMHPAQLLASKQRVLTTNLPEIATLTQRMLRASDPMKIRDLLDKLNA
ncbi:MAG: phosphoenolpyruvate--protein phosphotransferase [Gallionellales bacterium 35-53-114]|jgi:phosphotransferase system enzyme I (PtsI)|nr:MAG: phosphoenolpyruvate--protein phosphotransferase [Gallionellales bacterium 35-53-114]OYZ63534.1 MAG: phosphoenolpyruvate--protein phosphotransferase [Gallionellales bacterium 24-53-125]OZB10856.1 MAG: phosphoenolpyruvate--protein phosphotransferase [Gallionellales bacterium 39-52-133]HQS58969.1 phosphoenolpyruvate--protein phosphotransferase [Gallionellaceae bacterium]HQS75646.1 phosphoenolpyruvate--protein phosphotransferase [Gallionellaceae bacterium]